MPLRRYLALGDSYTVGEAVPTDASWPAQLVSLLRQRGIEVDDLRIVAVTGWTTDELAHGIDAARLSPGYDLVSLLIGVNDHYRDRPVDDYRAPFSALLERAITLASGRADRVLVVSIPDWGVTRFARQDARGASEIAEALDGYNAEARAQADAAGARFVDITGLSRAHPGEVTDDGLHPSGAQYTRWAELILPVAVRALA